MNSMLFQTKDSAAFKRFTEIKKDSKQLTQDLNEMRSGLESKFLKLKELIQSSLK